MPVVLSRVSEISTEVADTTDTDTTNTDTTDTDTTDTDTTDTDTTDTETTDTDTTDTETTDTETTDTDTTDTDTCCIDTWFLTVSIWYVAHLAAWVRMKILVISISILALYLRGEEPDHLVSVYSWRRPPLANKAYTLRRKLPAL